LICNQLKNLSITCCGGSPFFIGALVDCLEKNNLSLPSLRLIVIGSAGAHPKLLMQLSRVLPQTEVVICYGASEAEPIAVVHGADIIAEYDQETIGRGYLVGKVCDPLLVRIVASSTLDRLLQNPQAAIDIDHLHLPIDTIGEIIVSGPQVTDKYTNPLVSMEKKFYDNHGRLWHRTADRGCFDSNHQLWLAGRCGDQVMINDKEMDPFSLEIFVDSLPFVEKSAFIQSNSQKNAILYCRLTEKTSRNQHAEIIECLTLHLKKRNITGVLIEIVQKIPVDNRHNSKINRQKLRLKNQFFHFFQRRSLSDESRSGIH
jgi:olefin beta-lactone synthetase